MNPQKSKYAHITPGLIASEQATLTSHQLPGFGLPYDDWGQDPELYAQAISAVVDWRHDVTTIRERCMLFFVDRISDKPDWTRKVSDEVIVARWKQEAKELDWTKIIEGGDMTDKMLTYVSSTTRSSAGD